MIQKVLVSAGCLVAACVMYFAPVRGLNSDGKETFLATAHWDKDEGVGDWNTTKPVDVPLLCTRLVVVAAVTSGLAYAFRPKKSVK